MQHKTYQTSDQGLHVVPRSRSTLRPPSARPLGQLAIDCGPYGDQEVELARQAGQVGYLGRVLVQATLPHSRPREAVWKRRNGRFTLSLIGDPDVGLPYGVLPRLVLVWLTMEAKRTGSREVHLGRTLTEFMDALELGRRGGERGDITRLRNQLARLFSTTMFLRWDDRGTGQQGGSGMLVADEWMLFWDPKRPDQGSLWESSVVLSERFFAEISAHAVPLDMAILRALRRSPLALDVYGWLTYRLPLVKQADEIPWEALAGQFGAEYKRIRKFREKFLEALEAVLAQ